MILRYERRELRPGGGANAVANLRTLGAEVDVVGAVGEDSVGEELLELLREMKINTDGILVDPGNTQQLAQQLIDILSDHQLRIQLGGQGQQFVHKYRNATAMDAATSELIEMFRRE